MARNLYIGFKGKNNASCMLVESISGEKYLLTNSFAGLKRDIELLQDFYDCVILFGIDKTLKNSVRIEKTAEKANKVYSALDLENISARLDEAGISNCLSDKPTHYLCNEAYWNLLRKFDGKVVLIHIPGIKNMNEKFMENLKSSLT